MEKKNVLVSGCSGHMGLIVGRLINESDNFTYLYGFDRYPAPAGEFPGLFFCKNLDDIREEPLPDVIIDFSAPEATMQLLEFAKKFNIPIVIATTGFSEEEETEILKAAQVIPVFKSANMSFEICLLKNVLQLIAPKLGESDIEILETHHNRKKDAPSGTALLLANAIKDSFAEGEKKIIYGREGKREKDEIGISALRGGDVVGEHTIFFYGKNEKLEIKHSAFSRDLFAEGAIKAAEFLVEKTEPGFYTMDDLVSM